MAGSARHGVVEHVSVIPRACGVSSTPRLIDSITAASGILDHPPSRVMTTECVFAFSRRKAPEVCMNLVPPEREQGMPGACCTRDLVCNVHKEVRTRAYRYSRSTPAFPAQWFDGLCRALPGDEFLLPPSLPACWQDRSGPIKLATGSLTSATDARTTRFCRTLQRRSSCAPCPLTDNRPANTLRA